MRVAVELSQTRDLEEELHRLRILADSLQYERAAYLLGFLIQRFGLESDSALLKRMKEVITPDLVQRVLK